MPEYIYGCDKNKDHPRVNVIHGVSTIVELECQVCHAGMHRIPQPFLYGLSPYEILRDWSERNWSRKLRGEPRDYYNVSTERGKTQKDFNKRK